MIEESVPCMKDLFYYKEEGGRMIVIHLMVHLNSFQTVQVGINHTMIKYMTKHLILGTMISQKMIIEC